MWGILGASDNTEKLLEGIHPVVKKMFIAVE